MDHSSKAKEEYEIQLYGFPVSELRQAQKDKIESHVKSLLDELVASLIAASPESSPGSIAACNDLTPKITSSIMSSASDVLAKLDTLIVDTLSIPDNIVLPEHQLLVKNPSTAEDEHELHKEFDELNKICKQNGFFMTTLDAELQIHDTLLLSIEKELAMMDHVEALLLTNIEAGDERELTKALKIVEDKTVNDLLDG